MSHFQIALDAFGERFELELNRNLNLVPNRRPLNIFYADKDKEDIHYMASNEQVIFFCKKRNKQYDRPKVILKLFLFEQTSLECTLHIEIF